MVNTYEWDLDNQGSINLVLSDILPYLEGIKGTPFSTIITDPPYGIGIKGIDGKQWDNGFPPPEIWALLKARTESGGWIACFSGVKALHKSTIALEQGGWEIQDVMAWLKAHAIGRSGGLKRGWEAVILASNGKPRLMNTDSARVRGGGIPKWPSQNYADNNKSLKIKRGNPENRKETRSPSSVVIAAEDDGLLGDYDKYFITGRPTTKEKGTYNNHPSVKPVSLLEHLIVLLNRESGTVLDPFVGSGSTLIAAANLRVNAVGVEIDKDYFSIAFKRVDDFLSSISPNKILLFNNIA